jgi:signal transduction histidine kinase
VTTLHSVGVGSHFAWTRALRALRLAAVAFASLAFCLPTAADPKPRNVLVLYTNSRLLPANIEADRALRETIGDSANGPVKVFDEFLDSPDFGPNAFPHAATYLREKYASRPPDVIVAAAGGALSLLLANRAQLFPDVPIVYLAVSQAFLQSLPGWPLDGVVGVPAEYDFLGSAELGLRLHPKARRLVVVTGASTSDREWKEAFQSNVPQLEQRVSVEFWVGLTTEVLRKRLGDLTVDDVVFTPGYFQDGTGRGFTPRESVEAMAAASGAPIYGPFSTFLGHGIVGGSMWTFDGVARQGGEIVNALLAGTPAASLHLPGGVPWMVNVDWRQLHRWGIDEASLPIDAVVHFRSPSFLSEHRTAVAVLGLAFLLETILISFLLLERRRRRLAEQAWHQQRTELAHASRLAIAGELTGAIAHQMNQPLGAILTNADAADFMLQAGNVEPEKVREVIADIRRDDLRASEVIRRLRALIAKHEFEQQPFDLNEAVSDVESILRVEARQRRVSLDVRPSAEPVTIVGDRIQIQQVLINLLLNAMDAVSPLPETQRTVSVLVDAAGDSGYIAVRDFGPGIPSQDLPKLFDSFFSTKGTMGLGLSIARSLVDAHGGRIWAENVQSGGAVFHIELPSTRARAGVARGRG